MWASLCVYVSTLCRYVRMYMHYQTYVCCMCAACLHANIICAGSLYGVLQIVSSTRMVRRLRTAIPIWTRTYSLLHLLFASLFNRVSWAMYTVVSWVSFSPSFCLPLVTWLGEPQLHWWDCFSPGLHQVQCSSKVSSWCLHAVPISYFH